jgi:putative endonuclease
MDYRQHTGKQGEKLVTQWLLSKQVSVLHRNRRFGRYELDIVATKNNTLFCIEVKTRRSNSFGDAEDYISRQKIFHMQNAAEQLLEENAQFDEARLCVVSVEWKNKQPFFRVVEVR